MRSFIADNYKGPDESRIWLLGLSRGAYTVRAVSGMINNCGIVRRTWPEGSVDAMKALEKQARDDMLQDVYKRYCRCVDASFLHGLWVMLVQLLDNTIDGPSNLGMIKYDKQTGWGTAGQQYDWSLSLPRIRSCVCTQAT
jgi:hypothetical protein